MSRPKTSHAELTRAHAERIASKQAEHAAAVTRLENELSRERDTHHRWSLATATEHEAQLDAQHEAGARAAFGALREAFAAFRKERTYAAAEAFAGRFRQIEAAYVHDTGAPDTGRLLGFAASAVLLENAPERLGAFAPDQWHSDVSRLTLATVAAASACREIHGTAHALQRLAELESVVGSHLSTCTRASAPDAKQRFELMVFCRPASYEARCRELDAPIEQEKLAYVARENELAQRARRGEPVPERDGGWFDAVRRILN